MVKRYVLIDDDETTSKDVSIEPGPLYFDPASNPPGVGTFAKDFADEIAQTITVQAVSSSGLYGPTYGAAVSYSCYVKHTTQNIIDSSGDTVVSSMQIYLDGHPAGISQTSKINYGSESPKILNVVKRFDEQGGAYATIIYT